MSRIGADGSAAFELVARDVRPQIAGGAELCDLFKEVVVRVPEKGDAGCDFVERDAGPACRA